MHIPLSDYYKLKSIDVRRCFIKMMVLQLRAEDQIMVEIAACWWSEEMGCGELVLGVALFSKDEVIEADALSH